MLVTWYRLDFLFLAPFSHISSLQRPKIANFLVHFGLGRISNHVAQIRPKSQKNIFSCIRAFLVTQIHQNSHKIVFSCIRAFLVAQIRPNLHKIVFSYIRVFLVAQICPNSHKIVYSRVRAFTVAQIMTIGLL